jgi:hypothetical protein
MFAPIPPVPPERRHQSAVRVTPVEADAELALLRRLDGEALYEIVEGLDWCDRQLRALGPFRRAQRQQIARLRRRWAQRWSVATGRPAVSLQAHRAWQLAAILGVCGTLVALATGSDRQAAPLIDPALVARGLQVMTNPTASPQPVAAVATATPMTDPTAASAAPTTSDPSASASPVRSATGALARSRARRVARRLNRCHETTMTYLDCQGAGAGLRRYVNLGNVSEDRFTLIATTRSGSVFTILRTPDGASHRNCTGVLDGCPDSGHW